MSTNGFRQDADYWNRKVAAYLHDPPDKALRVPGHEQRSSALLGILGDLGYPDKAEYQAADIIAAGMDRTVLPGYERDPSRDGSIDFHKNPCLTHPTGAAQPLWLDLPAGIRVGEVSDQIREILTDDDRMLSDRHAGNPALMACARFHYLHHVFRHRLADEDVGGLGALWHRMPADTRIPDHSVWMHCGLVSSLSACFRLSQDTGRASIMVFSITPVQDFIARARKLRDYWIGSLLLSWLAFRGIRQIMMRFGSDHVLYPTLTGQPLVDQFLAEELLLPEWFPNRTTAPVGGVASFPNVFVFFAPADEGESIAQVLRNAVLADWRNLADELLKLMKEKTLSDDYLAEQIHRQTEHLWQFNWAACPLVEESTLGTVHRLLHQEVWTKPSEFCHAQQRISGGSVVRLTQGPLYAVSHALAQAFLAAGKTRRENIRPEEGGIKCQLHGDLEILRCNWKSGEDRNPRPREDPLWSKFKEGWKPASDFRPAERLSAVAMMKRVGHVLCKQIPAHDLAEFFEDAQRFPSTTEVALTAWLETVEPLIRKKTLFDADPNWDQAKKIICQLVHQRDQDEGEGDDAAEIISAREYEYDYVSWRKLLTEIEREQPLGVGDRYYAILLMDGDHMGRLLAGETLGATWDSVIHPLLVERLTKPDFDSAYRAFWESRLNERRLVSPGVHAAISEALADFSLRAVPSIIEKHHGRLIYAGGDDLCAVLPISTVVDAAKKIAGVYRRGFLSYPDASLSAEEARELRGKWSPQPGRLVLHLGSAEGISISGGILICHHKKPLSAAMRRAHELLDLAKSRGNRNALALAVDRRAGGERKFIARWDEEPATQLAIQAHEDSQESRALVDRFLELGNALGTTRARSVSSSLIYRLEELRPGLESIIDRHPEALVPFLVRQMERSGVKASVAGRDMACHMASLLARRKNERLRLDTESLIVAQFVGTSRARYAELRGE